jgi:hypothetical protein
MAGTSTRTGGEAGLGLGGLLAGAGRSVVAGVGGAVDGDASGRGGGSSPHAPRTRASVSDASQTAGRRLLATPAEQHAGREAGQQQVGPAGEHEGEAGNGGARRGPAGAGGDATVRRLAGAGGVHDRQQADVLAGPPMAATE